MTDTIEFPGAMGSLEQMYARGAFENYEKQGGVLTWGQWLDQVWYADE